MTEYLIILTKPGVPGNILHVAMVLIKQLTSLGISKKAYTTLDCFSY